MRLCSPFMNLERTMKFHLSRWLVGPNRANHHGHILRRRSATGNSDLEERPLKRCADWLEQVMRG
jgi:hypothetical protein